MTSPPLMSNAKPIFLPSVGLTHDGLDQPWSNPNRVSVEIFADHETTTVDQVVSHGLQDRLPHFSGSASSSALVRAKIIVALFEMQRYGRRSE
ncbi:hypothetical protein CSKR_203381 [Clonorchis sinensis]|uniref:Uncharacterized protein n=1 Tax=Clonorchis sinensis TaxID=79923 RepID=A0A8T1M9K3_CLOSI|nr:hypothetical protein CSKR_203381 [Clonorchis sinensis]